MGQKGNVNLENQLLEGNQTANTLTTNEACGGDICNGNIVNLNNGRFDVRYVWKYNLHEEFRIFRKCIQLFSYVLMDTKFPGVVARPIGDFRTSEEFLYQQLRCNVNLLDIIQLVFAFLDDSAKLPSGVPTWHFNFKFDLSENMFEEATINKLQNCGIEFHKHKEDGIDPLEFAALLFSSGIVLTDKMKWISFHNGLDLAYLVRLLTATDLPEDEGEFSELLKTYFPVICNIKNLSGINENQKTDLQKICLDMFKNQLKLQSE